MFYNIRLEMYKLQIKKIRIISFVILLFTQIIIFHNFSFADLSIGWALQSLLNTVEWNDPASSIFNWKVSTDNIYNKILASFERETAEKITIPLNEIRFAHPSLGITSKDLFNILYDSNRLVKLWTNHQCGSFLKNCVSNKEIKESYEAIRNILYEEGILKTDNINVITNKEISERVNSQFILISELQSNIDFVSNAALGKDLFFNGIEDDSDYDLQLDIKDIGDLMFESFIAPIETAFYGLPPNIKNPKHNEHLKNKDKNNVNTQEELKMILRQISQNSNQSSNTNTWVITKPEAIISWNNFTNDKENTTDEKEDKSFTTNDNELNDFITQTQFIQKISSTTHTIKWDICQEPITIDIPTIEEETYTYEELEQYLEELLEQIEEYENITPEDRVIPIINKPESESGNNQGWSSSEPDDWNIQEYIETILNSESSASCFNDCQSLPPSERVICQIQCLCFSVSLPQHEDPRLQSINDMLKVRFCMVPVQNMEVSKWVSIYSFDDILTRIHAITYNLVNNWEMIKYQKAPEFFNSPLAEMNFSKILSFQININTKPMFDNQPSRVKQAKAEEAKKEIIEKKENNSEIDDAKYMLNRNKYIVIADPVKIELSPLEEPLINPIFEWTSEILMSLSVFLTQNLSFREDVEEQLKRINIVAKNLAESEQLK